MPHIDFLYWEVGLCQSISETSNPEIEYKERGGP